MQDRDIILPQFENEIDDAAGTESVVESIKLSACQSINLTD